MIQFLQPIGLVAMAGVLIPVIVHLWNDRRGKVLRVGSVALMTDASRRLSWSRRLTQIGLLVVRCLLVIALAMLLAGPYWMRSSAGVGKGWVLIAGSDATVIRGRERWREMIDSLVKVGYERHVMDSSANYWDEFRRLDKTAPAGTAFFVFTPGLANRFSGSRPVTGREVHWQVYTPEDSVSQWVEAAWRVSADSIMVERGMSLPAGTQYRRERVGTRATVYEGIAVDTAVMRVAAGDIYTRAALKALGEYTGRRITILPGKTDSGGNAKWSEAAWDGRLPVVLGRMLFGFSGRKEMDRRVLDPEQVAPVRVAGGAGDGPGLSDAGPGVGAGFGNAGTGVAAERIDLRPLLWGMVFVLFLIERIMVFRNDKA